MTLSHARTVSSLRGARLAALAHAVRGGRNFPQINHAEPRDVGCRLRACRSSGLDCRRERTGQLAAARLGSDQAAHPRARRLRMRLLRLSRSDGDRPHRPALARRRSIPRTTCGRRIGRATGEPVGSSSGGHHYRRLRPRAGDRPARRYGGSRPARLQPNGSRMAERERRIRLAYLAGAESWSRETTGRGLAESELEGVVRRFR